jgi:hypothetical protein
MDLDDFLDPYRPLADHAEVLAAHFDAADPERTVAQFPPVFQSLYEDDRELCRADQPPDLAGRVRRFIRRVKDLSHRAPSPEQLGTAPVLHLWCAARLGSFPFLLGHVTGHPRLRSGTRARTSVLFQVAPDLGWARMWNRYYVLADHTSETLFRLQAEGKLC